ncbi:ketopantoate hydroxymethyltransferase [Paenibacillus sp. alder61]|uniref:ketopantoate hydroxymethyltransferase n=1 Tax=Paenibacillus sp. alder61 TaxID=2862948 RepID=UPI001CD25E18|nr:ketopantoate hydroxymethyltransferase [Paenibacillus sp. alder61]MCA1293115.1 ketopantoate hydroxymethyltransferase [Paenibacillus sp. alder61]
MIAEGILHDVAEYVNGRVAKVVLNGTYTITDFEVKSVTDKILVLNYIIPVAEIPLVTLIELKDAADTVLSSNAVNIPIAADHLMLQTIEVKEGN